MVAYPLMVITIGLCGKLSKKNGFTAYFLGMLASLIICYLFGSAWLAISAHMTFGAAVMAGVVPFVVFDIIKAALAAYLCVVLKRTVKTVVHIIVEIVQKNDGICLKFYLLGKRNR